MQWCGAVVDEEIFPFKKIVQFEGSSSAELCQDSEDNFLHQS
jgi:hypothetical protein